MAIGRFLQKMGVGVTDALSGGIRGALTTRTALKAPNALYPFMYGAGGIARAGLGTVRATIRHPRAALATGAILAGGGTAMSAMAGPGEPSVDELAQYTQAAGVPSTGVVGPIVSHADFINSTEGLVQGLHRGRHRG